MIARKQSEPRKNKTQNQREKNHYKTKPKSIQTRKNQQRFSKHFKIEIKYAKMRRYLLPHIALPGLDGSIEQPRQAIKLGGFNSRRPHAGVLITKEDMALIVLDGPGERTLPEIRPSEAELWVRLGISGAEKTVVLVTVRGASDEGSGGVREVAVEMVGDGNWGRRGWWVGGGECERVFSVSAIAAHHHRRRRRQEHNDSLSLSHTE